MNPDFDLVSRLYGFHNIQTFDDNSFSINIKGKIIYLCHNIDTGIIATIYDGYKIAKHFYDRVLVLSNANRYYDHRNRLQQYWIASDNNIFRTVYNHCDESNTYYDIHSIIPITHNLLFETNTAYVEISDGRSRIPLFKHMTTIKQFNKKLDDDWEMVKKHMALTYLTLSEITYKDVILIILELMNKIDIPIS